ncbi:MAG: restriction endonuclease subunit S [Planctomycetota bacterium]
MGSVSREVKRRAKTGSKLPVYAVTKHSGFVPSLEYFKKQVFSRDTKGYKEIHKNEIAYATIHLDEGSIGIGPEDCIISPMYTGFEVDTNEVLPEYLVRFLKSPEALATYELLGNGSVHRRKAISFSRLATLSVPLPSLPEQRRIADILDKADAIRRKRQESIALTEDFLRSAFHNMFGDPVKNPKGWDSCRLDSLTSEMRYGTSKKCALTEIEGSRPVLRIPNIKNGGINWVDLKYTTLEQAEANRVLLQQDDLLFVRTNGNPDHIGRCAVFDDKREALFASYLIRARLTPGSPTSSQFIQSVVSFPTFRSRLIREAKTTAGNYNINTRGLGGLEIITPPKPLQEDFLALHDNARSAKRNFELHRKRAAELFDSLSQCAYKGEL